MIVCGHHFCLVCGRIFPLRSYRYSPDLYYRTKYRYRSLSLWQQSQKHDPFIIVYRYGAQTPTGTLRTRDAGERHDELSPATAEEEKEAAECTKRAKRAERRRHATSLWARARRQQFPEPPCSRGTTRGKATCNRTYRDNNFATVVQERAPCQNP